MLGALKPAFEGNRFVAYNLDESDEATAEKNALAFDNLAFRSGDDSDDDDSDDDDGDDKY